VTAQPDVTELALGEGDEFLVVASDGLWDVLDSQEVVKLARRDLQRGQTPQARTKANGGGRTGCECRLVCGPGPRLLLLLSSPQPPSPPHPSRVAALLLTCSAWPVLQEIADRLSQLAVKRGSQDNITVILVDLGRVDWGKQGGGGSLLGGLGSLFGSR
jgi:hypothetical protein